MTKRKENSPMQFAGRVWVGVFDNFEEAAEKDPEKTVNVWDDKVWMHKQVDKLRDAIQQLDDKAACISEPAQSGSYFLPAFLAALSRYTTRPKVLDFGGGLATSYFPILGMLPEETEFEFLIVENEVICKEGNNFFKNDKKIKFSSQLPVNEKFDIIHFGSSIHYIDEYESLISHLRTMDPEYLIFGDVPAGDIETFVTQQQYYGRKIPVRFWNVVEFINKIEGCGFRLLLKARFPIREIDMNAITFFPEERQLSYFSQLVFVPASL